ncbi:TPA: (2Fe-2S)-binding protein [Candidatus Woesearchaeota archaeon]|nr:(2Fe-2S)-binding protein [Candidatus Woesearchaeota archaeon]HIH31727.1 (2Fe-2S)-binding protein [Candidatus Woesearchaeota archaeon]HIH55031.1 (2Fe-2S)-binding protein [Candidatus Woesearchaeota archaeon]HIJ01039.1 (2Fe-2S)-binding protein [Candidatus Woesearchaeota archaeon]HIJ14755.1 (2Fe-2S)-binding protein [Candidatus Woesearchaeota archaeon]
MAIIFFNDNSIEVPENSSIIEACEQLGISFGCMNGFCRTCEAYILEGYENLSPLTEKESMLKDNEGLLCQCTVNKGLIRIKQKYLN